MMLGGMTYFLHFLTFLPEKNLEKKQKKLNFGRGGGLFWPLLLKKVKKNICMYTKTNVFSIVIFWII